MTVRNLPISGCVCVCDYRAEITKSFLISLGQAPPSPNSLGFQWIGSNRYGNDLLRLIRIVEGAVLPTED